MKNQILCLLVLTTLLCACAKKDDNHTKSVPGTASILLGPSGVTSQSLSQASQIGTMTALTNGVWRLSPNKAKITFTRIDLISASSGKSISASLANCSVTYDRSNSSGTKLLDCPFTLQLTSEDGGVSYQGSYVGMIIYYQRTIQILLDGTTSGIYSDPDSPTKLSTSAPSGGAQYIDYEIGGGTGDVSSQVYFTTPLNVSDQETPSVQIVTDMIQTVMGQVSGGVPSLQSNSGSAPVELIALPGGVTPRSEFYGTPATIESTYQEGDGGSEYLYVRVFYAGDQPVTVSTSGYIASCLSGSGISQAFSIDPSKAPLQSSNGNKAGGYLGLSSSGDLAWAFATSWLWTQYSALFVMPRKTTIGETSLFKCQTTSTVPLPADGDTYASGTPTITPSVSYTLKLLAN